MNVVQEVGSQTGLLGESELLTYPRPRRSPTSSRPGDPPALGGGGRLRAGRLPRETDGASVHGDDPPRPRRPTSAARRCAPCGSARKATSRCARSAHTPEHADVPAALIDLIAAVGATTDYGAASHAVVGLPGSVDYEVGRLLWAPHLPEGWPEQLSRDELTRAAGPARGHRERRRPAPSVGEAAFGAGAGSTDVAYLTVSTGIGAGVVYGGRLLRGTRSLAEVGHTVIEWRAWREGLPCTLEELGSGSGVARMARGGRPHRMRRPGGRGGGGRRRRQGDRHLAAPSPPAPPAWRTSSCPSPRAPSSSAAGSAGARSSSARCASSRRVGPSTTPPISRSCRPRWGTTPA